VSCRNSVVPVWNRRYARKATATTATDFLSDSSDCNDNPSVSRIPYHNVKKLSEFNNEKPTIPDVGKRSAALRGINEGIVEEASLLNRSRTSEESCASLLTTSA